jgi:hypothetical protein
MTPEQFKEFWTSTYPETLPIPHFFKQDCPDRWFRIHSLPQSKRYADTDEEWNILLMRHNDIITDILGDNAKALLLTGDYNYDEPNEAHITEQEPGFLSFSFQRLDDIDLFELSPEHYDKGQVYRPAFAETIWKPHHHDNLLRDIADDKIRASFISPDRRAITAPYDGGIDFVLKDREARDFYKDKYKDWLSDREDGL